MAVVRAHPSLDPSFGTKQTHREGDEVGVNSTFEYIIFFIID